MRRRRRERRRVAARTAKLVGVQDAGGVSPTGDAQLGRGGRERAGRLGGQVVGHRGNHSRHGNLAGYV